MAAGRSIVGASWPEQNEVPSMPEYEWISDDIFTVSGFLEAAECEGYIRLSESHGFGDAPIETSFGPSMRKDIRNNTRVMLDDPGLAQLVWDPASLYVPKTIGGHDAIGVNERFRFYRYDPGQTFRWHRDGYFERPNRERSRLTLMVYLNDDFDGGLTRFRKSPDQTGHGDGAFLRASSATRGCRGQPRSKVRHANGCDVFRLGVRHSSHASRLTLTISVWVSLPVTRHRRF